MSRKFLVGLGVVTSFVLSGAQPCVLAQETPQPEIAVDALQMREIAVKNVPVRMMAWWLDAMHNAEPVSIQQARSNVRAFGDGSSIPIQSGWKTLPADVKSVIVASDERNSILVVGSKAGIQTVADAVQKFDKPLRQIAVEVQAIRISEADTKTLNLKFSALEGEINVGRATPITLARTEDSEALRLKVRDLMFWDQAKIVSSPHVTAIDGLTASLRSQESHPFLLSFEKGDNFPTPLVNSLVKDSTVKGPGAILYLSTASGLTVTPTVNKNDTISLDLMPAKTLQVSISSPETRDSGANAALVGTLEGFRYQLTVANGETVAFGGVSTALYTETEDDKQLPSNMILLVTARILPRFGDDEMPDN